MVPQLRRENSLLLWNVFDLNTPVHTFVGHDDVVLEFQWRRQKEGMWERRLLSFVLLSCDGWWPQACGPCGPGGRVPIWAVGIRERGRGSILPLIVRGWTECMATPHPTIPPLSFSVVSCLEETCYCKWFIKICCWIVSQAERPWDQCLLWPGSLPLSYWLIDWLIDTSNQTHDLALVRKEFVLLS